VKQLSRAVHPMLDEIPDGAACSMVCCILCAIFAFLFLMTCWQWYWNCLQNMSLLDAQWNSYDDDNAEFENATYKQSSLPVCLCHAV
jgi:TRAP-type C4-dicarboxylate transport system permease small subunit